MGEKPVQGEKVGEEGNKSGQKMERGEAERGWVGGREC
jgi:hypothetical protein